MVAQRTGRPNAGGGESAVIREKPLPQNGAAERAVLGSIEIDPACIVRVLDVLRPDSFDRHEHRIVFAAMRELHEAGVTPDLITLIDHLRETGRLADAGGQAGVSELANNVPSSERVEEYAAIVASHAARRQLVKAGIQIATLGYDEPSASAALSQADRLLRTVADSYSGANTAGRLRLPDTPEMADAWMEAFTARVAIATSDATDAAAATMPMQGIPSGLRMLDSYLGGLERRKLVTVAARPGHGKSALALTLALNAARAGNTVGLFSLEMDAQDVMTRAISLLSNVPHERLRQPTDVSDDEWEAITRGYEIYRSLPFALDDTRGLSVDDIAARARRFVLRANTPIDVLVVDYLQIISEPVEASSAGGGRRYGGQVNRQQLIGQMTRALRRLASELDCCVVLLAQLSRAVEQRTDKKPQLSDLRESGDIENDSDVVLLLWREDVHNPESDRPHLTDVIVAKNRAGKTGQFTLYFDDARVAFRNMTTLDA